MTFDVVQSNGIDVMAPIDALPPEWRKLVHEFGRDVTLEVRESFSHDIDMGQFVLEQWRAKRQEQWLATSYITPRTRRGFEARY